MRNYKQIDITEEKEERVRKRDIFSVMFAVLGVTIMIWGLI